MGYQTRSHGLILAALLLASPVAAQVRPGNFSTLNTTDTSADSLHVGCAVGSSTCTGGIKAGPITATTIAATGAITGTTIALTGGTSSLTNVNATLNITTGTGTTTTVQPGLVGTSTNQAFSLLQNNSVAFGINTAKDWTLGATAHIVDSVGTPTFSVSSGGVGTPTVAGTDYAILVTTATGQTSISVNFGHTWSTAPICVASSSSTPPALGLRMTTSTTAFTIGDSTNSMGNSVPIYVLCRGF